MAKRALIVGCNYPNSQYELKGCVNDAKNMRDLLMQYFGFPDEDVIMMIDTDTSYPQPTGANIRAALKKIVTGTQPGDKIFFHYSGHGTQVPAESGEEDDTGMDECIVPSDINLMSDDDFREIVNTVPLGVTFTFMSDSCHSGGLIDKTELQIGESGTGDVGDATNEPTFAGGGRDFNASGYGQQGGSYQQGGYGGGGGGGGYGNDGSGLTQQFENLGVGGQGQYGDQQYGRGQAGQGYGGGAGYGQESQGGYGTSAGGYGGDSQGGYGGSAGGYGGESQGYGGNSGGYGGVSQGGYGGNSGGYGGESQGGYGGNSGGYGGGNQGGYGGNSGGYGGGGGSRNMNRNLPLSMLTSILSKKTGMDVGVGGVRPALFSAFGKDSSPMVQNFMAVLMAQGPQILQAMSGGGGGGKGQFGMMSNVAMQVIKSQMGGGGGGGAGGMMSALTGGGGGGGGGGGAMGSVMSALGGGGGDKHSQEGGSGGGAMGGIMSALGGGGGQKPSQEGGGGGLGGLMSSFGGGGGSSTQQGGQGHGEGGSSGLMSAAMGLLGGGSAGGLGASLLGGMGSLGGEGGKLNTKGAYAGAKPDANHMIASDMGILVSGCQSNETSADANPDGNPDHCFGALSHGVQEVVKNSSGPLTNRELVKQVRAVLQKQGYSQHPCLYCSDNNVDQLFILGGQGS
eukprot:jgi/Mesen1/10898/ME000095S10231